MSCNVVPQTWSTPNIENFKIPWKRTINDHHPTKFKSEIRNPHRLKAVMAFSIDGHMAGCVKHQYAFDIYVCVNLLTDS